MAEFKVGDRVRIGAANGGYAEVPEQGLVPGNTGTVRKIHGGRCYSVLTDNADAPHNGKGFGWAFYEHEIEPIGGNQ